MSKTIATLKQILADTYALVVKTQNYHWNVTGPNFISLHEMFESHYDILSEQVDDLAERIRALGELSPGSLKEFSKATKISEPNGKFSANEMLNDLAQSYKLIASSLKEGMAIAVSEDDSVTEDMFIEFKTKHDKTIWMLEATLA